MMAKCVQCGITTQLHDGERPFCLDCSIARREQSPTAKHKLPDSQPTLASINENLTSARAKYRKALTFQTEISQLRDALGPSNSDGSQALHNANRELSFAAGKYEDALRDFMNFTDPHRRSS
jgi:hypothetical protein